MPSAPEVDESDSIHPEAYGRVPKEPSVHSPGLADREAVSRELIALCEAELGRSKDSSRRARLHYECARLYESPLGELNEALQHYLKARSLESTHLPALSGLRRVRLLRGEWTAALEVLSEEIELCRSPEVRGALHFQRAVILDERLRQPSEAREAYEKALEQLPSDAATLRALARTHRRDRQFATLNGILDAQANLVGDEPTLLAARLAERARNVELHPDSSDEATDLYRRAVRADALGSAALPHAVRLLAGLGHHTEIVELERQRVRLLSDPRLRVASLLATADLLSEHLADVIGAAALLEQAASEIETDPTPLSRLVGLYERLGDHDARVRTLERLESSERDPSVRLQLRLTLADAHRARGRDCTPAIHWLNRALEIDPENPYAADALAELHRTRGEWDALVTVLRTKEKACNDLEVRAALLVELADVYERQLGDTDQAISCHQAVLSLRPHHAGAFRVLIRLLRKKQRFAELVELHERAVEATQDDAEAISHLVEAALIHEDLLNDPAAALGVFRRILERDSRNLTALRGAQRLSEASGDGHTAVEMIEREIALVGDSARKIELMLRAAEICERQLHDESKALSILEEVRSLDAENRPALAATARIHRRQDRHGELVETLLEQAKQLTKPRERGRLHFEVARIIDEQLADKKRALEHYESAYEQDGSELLARAYERALESTDRFEDLAAHLERRLASLEAPLGRYRLAMELGRIQQTRLGNVEAALDAFDLALASMPDSMHARAGRAHCLGQLKRFDELVQELEGIEQWTTDPAARLWSLLAAGDLLEGELGNPEQAILRYERVLELVPDHRAALTALERLYQTQGRIDDLTGLLEVQVATFGTRTEQVASLRELSRLAHRKQDSTLDHEAALAVLEREPDDVRALSELELHFLKDRDARRLAEIDDAWVRRYPAGPQRAAHRTRLAEFLEPVNPLQALETHRPALEEDPENIGSARAITRLAEVVGDVPLRTRAAETEYSVVGSPSRASALLRSAAEDEVRAGRTEQAGDLLVRALTLNPDDAESASALHAIFTKLGEYDKLIAALTTAAGAAKDPEIRAGHWITAARLMATARQDLGAGIAALSRVALAQPGHAPTLLELAELYIQDRQWGPAAERLKKALDGEPDPRTANLARLRLAEVYHEHLERTSEAAGLLRKVIHDAPQEHRALRRLLAIEIASGAKSAVSTAEAWAGWATGKERAEALTTLGRLQRDAGKTDEAKQCFAQAIALTGLSEAGADRDLVRMLEKEEQAGQSADWSVYAGALSTFCSGDAATSEKTRALLEASGILIDRVHDHEHGYAALRAGLSLEPKNFALQEGLCRRLMEGKSHDRALTELHKLIELDPSRQKSWSDLTLVFDKLGKNAEAHLALGPLVMLGGGSDLQRATWSSHKPRSATIAEGSVDDGVLHLASHASLPDGVHALLVQLSMLAPKIVEAGPERYGLTSRDRIGSRGTHPARHLLDRLARAFGVHEIDLYPAGGNTVVDLVLAEPVGIVIPDAFDNLTESQQIFCLGRQVARSALGMQVPAAVGVEQTLLLMAAAAWAVGVDVPAPGFDADEVAETGRRLGKAVPWLSKGRFEEAARRAVADLPSDLGVLLGELDRGCLRLAMVLADDLSCLTLLQQHSESLLGIAPGNVGAILEDLLKFWVSPDAMSIRRQVGLI